MSNEGDLDHPVELSKLSQTLAENTAAAIFIVSEANHDQESRILYANPAACAITGYSAQELKGMEFWKLASSGYQAEIRQMGLGNPWEEDVPIRFELVIKTSGGEERWLDIITGSVEYSGAKAALMTAFDITERCNTERTLRLAHQQLISETSEKIRALEEANQRLEGVIQARTPVADALAVQHYPNSYQEYEMETILEAIGEAVIIYGLDGLPRWANRAALSIFGFDVVGVDRKEIIHRLDMRDSEERLQSVERLPSTRALKGETVSYERMHIKTPTGEDHIALVSASPLLENKQLQGAVIILNDITDSVRQQERAEQYAFRAQMLVKLTQSFSHAGLQPKMVFNTIVNQISKFSGDACALFLTEEDGHTLNLSAYHHPLPEAMEVFEKISKSFQARIEGGIVGQVFQTGEPQLLQNLREDSAKLQIEPNLQPWIEKYPIQSGIFVPVRTLTRKFGVLSLLRLYPYHNYSSGDVEFYQDLADRAALAIENSQLYFLETNRARELEALRKATTAVLSTLDLDVLLSQILDAAQQAIPTAEQGMLHLLARETGQLEERAAQAFHDLRIQKVSQSRIEGYLARAVTEKKPFLVQENQANAPAVMMSAQDRETKSSWMARSAIIAPLLLGNQVLGVLSLIHSKPNQFTQSDLRMLVSFAATVTMAIQNATLYTEVQRLATTDTLTGLLNRRRLFELGDIEIDRYQRFGHELSAIMLDVDDLKTINDNYGHATGDRVLQSLSDRCRAILRRVDIVGRYGGDELVILLPETSLAEARDVAERLRRTIESDKILTEYGQIKPTASLGVASMKPEIDSLKKLLALADGALYRAKQNGRNRVESY